MCRIAGFRDFGTGLGYDVGSILRSMRDALSAGGPDDAGEFFDLESQVALGHRRLSIIDLSKAGHQPIADESGRYLMVFNGEVYNYRDIRRELEQERVSFRSNSDSEVVVNAFAKWGQKAVEKFRGMFAFAVWDKQDRTLTLCRDRIGVKPLYWYYKDGLFMFASELKAFHQHPSFKKKLSMDAVSLFLQYGYITAPHSIFENTYKLEPGCFLTLNDSGEISQKRYWSVSSCFSGPEMTEKSDDEWVAELEPILSESFNLRMVSDVPVGVFLSGGVDSSIVTALIQKESIAPVKTFTIGFEEERFNEAVYARKIADHLGTEHHEEFCTFDQAKEIIPKLPDIYDEPFGDSSAIPTYLVSQVAKQHVKVSLSADGGDEQFAGYHGYRFIHQLATFSKFPFANQSITLAEKLGVFNWMSRRYPSWNNSKDKIEKLRHVLAQKSRIEIADVVNQNFGRSALQRLGDIPFLRQINGKFDLSTDDPSHAFQMDLTHYLPDDILVKVDRASMAVALEGRDPFLDHKVIEFTSQIPYKEKIKGGFRKQLLRKLLYKYVPRELVDRPKQGFGIPMVDWLQNDCAFLIDEYLSENSIRNSEIFESDEVSKIVSDFRQNRGVQVNKVWFLLMFQMWHRRWMS